MPGGYRYLYLRDQIPMYCFDMVKGDRSPDTLRAPKIRLPSPPHIRLARSLIEVVRAIFSQGGLIRYK